MSGPLCRMKRMLAGLPYGRSTCDQCGSLLRANFKCPEEEKEPEFSLKPTTYPIISSSVSDPPEVSDKNKEQINTISDTLRWIPLSEYEHPPYVGYDPLVLLGWEDLSKEHSNGKGGMLSFGVGYFDKIRGLWRDVSDKKHWSWEPTHFALICQDIGRPRKN